MEQTLKMFQNYKRRIISLIQLHCFTTGLENKASFSLPLVSLEIFLLHTLLFSPSPPSPLHFSGEQKGRSRDGEHIKSVQLVTM